MEARDIRNLQRAYLDVYGEAFVDPETGEAPSGRSPVENISYHPKKSVRRKAMGAFAHQMGKEYGGKWKSKSSDPVHEDINIDEAKQKVKIHTDKPIEYKIADIGPGKKEYNVKTSKGYKEEVDLYDAILTHLLDEGYAETLEGAEVIMVNMSEGWREDILDEVYDADVMGSSQIRKTGEGGRVGTLRKKSGPERRRVKAIGGGKTEPVEYKPRTDIGSQRQASTRVQQPTQERGSADVRARAAAAAREERIKAAKARAAAAKKGEASDTQAKAKPKAVSQQATQLLSKKAEKKPVSPDYTPAKASGHTEQERAKIRKAAEKLLRADMKAQEVAKYKKETGENPSRSAMTKLLGRVEKRMST